MSLEEATVTNMREIAAVGVVGVDRAPVIDT